MQQSYPSSTYQTMYIVRAIANTYNWLTKNIRVHYLIILLFGYTAFSKVEFFTANHTIDVSSFRTAMFKSPAIRPYVDQLKYIIPAAEFLICLLLLFNKTKLIGYYASLLLFAMFTGYIVYMFTHYPILPCTCGGVITKLSWKNHLLLNIGFILFTANAIYLMHKRPKQV